MLKKLLAAIAACCAASAFAATDVNTATAEDLNGVKGIGPAMSARIIEERQKGQFKDWDDLKARVKGIGNKRAEKLSGEGLTVDGTSYNSTTTKPNKAASPAPSQASAPEEAAVLQ